MPRPRRVAEEPIKDEALPGLSDLDQDPQPAGSRRRGRPPGSTTKKAAPKITARTSTGRVASKAQLKAQVATELYGIVSMFAALWDMRDPECAGVLTEQVMTINGQQERLAAIVEQTVELLSGNDKVLAAMANAGMIGRASVLAGLLVPVGKTVWKAHGPGGHRHGAAGLEGDPNGYAAHYPAPTLANA